MKCNVLKKKDMEYLRHKASTVGSNWVRVYYKPSRIHSNHLRFAISASNKLGPAVVRNRIKRIIREFIRNTDCSRLEVDALIVVHNNLFKTFEDPKVAEQHFKKSLKCVWDKLKEHYNENNNHISS